MKAKLYGIGVLLLSLVCFFQLEISAQKNQQLLLKKKDAGNSTDISKAVLDEINAARQNPQQFIGYLEEYRKRFTGLRVSQPDGKFMVTAEGVTVVDEAIAFLRNLSPIKPLQLAKGLASSADLQLRDLIVNSALGHKGADGSSFAERIKRFGTAKENLAKTSLMAEIARAK